MPAAEVRARQDGRLLFRLPLEHSCSPRDFIKTHLEHFGEEYGGAALSFKTSGIDRLRETVVFNFAI